MPGDLSASMKAEKNALASAHAIIALVEIVIPGEAGAIRLADNPANVTWPSSGGDVYTAYPMALDTSAPDSEGRLPAAVLRVANAAGLIEPYVESLDGATCRMITVCTGYLAAADVIDDQTFEILEVRSRNDWLSLSLGIENPLNRRFPLARYSPHGCRWRFRSAACGFSGGIVSLDDVVFHAGTPATITSVTGFWGADYAIAGGRRIRVTGSAGNDGEYLLATAAETTLTLATGLALVDETAAGTVRIEVVCPHNLDACAALGRAEYFGGSPGVEASIYVA